MSPSSFALYLSLDGGLEVLPSCDCEVRGMSWSGAGWDPAGVGEWLHLPGPASYSGLLVTFKK